MLKYKYRNFAPNMAENKLSVYSDEHFMKEALKEAQKAFERDEVPVGAVVVCNNQIIARAHNLTEQLLDVTAHAEMQAYTSATEYLGGKSLADCTLYVTLEPCVMCMGAAYNTRIGRIVFGAFDEKRGFSRIARQIEDKSGFIHPKARILGGVLEEECSSILKDFFASKRD